MPPEEEKMINLFEELGISDERSHEINMEMGAIKENSELLSEMLAAIPETYDRESVVVGVFLAEIILRDNGRLLPGSLGNANIIVIPPHAREVLDELLSDLLSKMGKDEPEENSTKGDPTQN